MRTSMQKMTAAALALVVAGLASPASATCTRLGFSVNDYGKDGPSRDAKMLLDKYIAKWAVEKGIKNYKTGPKNVKCELFLDFGVFDEHTCRAEASVCWEGPAVPGMPSANPQNANADGTVTPTPAKPKAAAKAKVAPAADATAAKATTPENNASRTETSSTTKAAAPAVEAAKAPEAPKADSDAAKAAVQDAAKDSSAPAATTGSTSAQ
jgi:hypothetical protein